MQSSDHCPSPHLIHQHYPTVVGLFTSNIPACILQPPGKPEAPKTSWADGELCNEVGALPTSGVTVKLTRSEMVPTRQCTKSCPDTDCSLLWMRNRDRSTPPASTQVLCRCCPLWGGPHQREELAGGGRGSEAP